MQYAVQGVKRLVVSVCHLVSQSVCHAKKIGINTLEYFKTSSKHINQLENSRIRMYAYLAEANAVHSIHNS